MLTAASKKQSKSAKTLQSRGNKFSVTINSADDDPHGDHLKERSIPDIERLVKSGDVTYAIGSWETGEQERLHLQCCLHLKDWQRCSWVGARVYRSYVEVQKGTDDQMIKYCCDPDKPGFISKAFEFGARSKSAQGKRSDIDNCNEAIDVGELTSMEEVNNRFPGIAARYTNWVNWRLELAESKRGCVGRYQSTYQPYVWQHWLYRHLTEHMPTERKILFVVDRTGRSGKSRFVDEFAANPTFNSQLLRPSKSNDMANALNVSNDVLFVDIPRKKEEYVSHVYEFLEAVKDGKVFSPKFHSRMKVIRPCHVVVFMNFDVQDGTHSETNSRGEIVQIPPAYTYDRYAIWELSAKNRCVEFDETNPKHTKCPPFKTFDSNFHPRVWNPFEEGVSKPWNSINDVLIREPMARESQEDSQWSVAESPPLPVQPEGWGYRMSSESSKPLVGGQAADPVVPEWIVSWKLHRLRWEQCDSDYAKICRKLAGVGESLRPSTFRRMAAHEEVKLLAKKEHHRDRAKSATFFGKKRDHALYWRKHDDMVEENRRKRARLN